MSLISYHFGGKEGLYLAIIRELGVERLNEVREILKPAQSIEDFRVRLTLHCSAVLRAHVERPDLYTIIHRECESRSPLFEDLFRSAFMPLFEVLIQFLSEAQKNGIMRGDLDPTISAHQLMSGLLQFAKMDGVNEKYFGHTLKHEPYRVAVVNNAIQLFLKGCTPA